MARCPECDGCRSMWDTGPCPHCAKKITITQEREEVIRCLDQIESKIFSIKGMHAQVPEIISICIALRSWLKARGQS